MLRAWSQLFPDSSKIEKIDSVANQQHGAMVVALQGDQWRIGRITKIMGLVVTYLYLSAGALLCLISNY